MFLTSLHVFVDLRAGQDGRFSIDNIVELQSSMQGAKP